MKRSFQLIGGPLPEGRNQYLLAFLLLSLFFGQAAYLVSVYSQAHDEPLHTVAGALYLQSGRFSGGTANPPFLQVLFGLPSWLGLSTYDLKGDRPPYGGRMVNVALGLLLVIVASLWSYKLFGNWGGTLTLALFAFSPSFIAHTAITTTDVGVTTLIVLAIYVYWQGHESKSILLTVLSGGIFGLAFASKFTAAALIPVAIFIELFTSRNRQATWLRVLVNLLLVSIACWIVFSSVYLFDGCFYEKRVRPDLKIPIPSFLAWMSPTQAVKGLEIKLSEMTRPGIHYYLGEYTKSGYWYYYPTIICLKTPMGTVFLALVFIYLIVSRAYIPKSYALYSMVPGLWFYFSFLTTNQAQGGIRHILPCYAFLFISLGALGKFVQRSRPIRIIVTLSLVVNFITVGPMFPYYLSYFNVLGDAFSKGPFPCVGPDLDYAQAEYFILDRLEQLPQDKPIYICPKPTARPLVGHIVINCDSYLFMRPGSRHDYDWLDGFAPKRVSRAWLLYDISEEMLRKQAKNKRASYEQVRTWVEYLLWEKRYEQTIKECVTNYPKHPFLIAQWLTALILLERYDEALHRVLVHLRKEQAKPPEMGELYMLCRHLCGKGIGREKEQQAKALLGLMTINEPLTRDLREKIIAKAGFKERAEFAECCIHYQAYIGVEHCLNKRFDRALQILKPIHKDKSLPWFVERFYRKVKNHERRKRYSRGRGREIYALTKSSESIEMDPQGALDRVRYLLESRPSEYDSIIALHRMNGMQRRGRIVIDLKRNSLWDRIDSKNHLFFHNRTRIEDKKWDH